VELPDGDTEIYSSVDYIKRDSCDINCALVAYNNNKLTCQELLVVSPAHFLLSFIKFNAHFITQATITTPHSSNDSLWCWKINLPSTNTHTKSCQIDGAACPV